VFPSCCRCNCPARSAESTPKHLPPRSSSISAQSIRSFLIHALTTRDNLPFEPQSAPALPFQTSDHSRFRPGTPPGAPNDDRFLAFEHASGSGNCHTVIGSTATYFAVDAGKLTPRQVPLVRSHQLRPAKGRDSGFGELLHRQQQSKYSKDQHYCQRILCFMMTSVLCQIHLYTAQFAPLKGGLSAIGLHRGRYPSTKLRSVRARARISWLNRFASARILQGPAAMLQQTPFVVDNLGSFCTTLVRTATLQL
jgi:hypothetical protein